MKFKLEFFARLNGALGVRYLHSETIDAESKEKAVLKLYEKYESISELKVTQLEHKS